MRIPLDQLLKKLLITCVVISSSVSASSVIALSPADSNSQRSASNQSHLPPLQTELRSVPKPLRWVQSGQNKFRSKGDVVQEVKRRYDARVLKISLNERREVYNVRILLPGGKVRNIQVSALR